MSTDTEPTDRERCTCPCDECGDPPHGMCAGGICDGPGWARPEKTTVCGSCGDGFRFHELEAALKLSEARNAILREALEAVHEFGIHDDRCLGLSINDCHKQCSVGIARRALSQAAALGTAQAE